MRDLIRGSYYTITTRYDNIVTICKYIKKFEGEGPDDENPYGDPLYKFSIIFEYNPDTKITKFGNQSQVYSDNDITTITPIIRQDGMYKKKSKKKSKKRSK